MMLICRESVMLVLDLGLEAQVLGLGFGLECQILGLGRAASPCNCQF